MTCYKTYLLLRQYWSKILSLSLGLLFQSASQPLAILFLQKLLKCAMNTPRAPVTSCLIESDALSTQTSFYDVKTELLYF